MRRLSSASFSSGMSTWKERMSVAGWTVVLMATSAVGRCVFRMTSSLYTVGAKNSISSSLTRSRLVVMHPVRRVGQALHAVEVGHVVAAGLGEVGAEVGILLPPDHQCGRRDRAKLCRGCRGFLLGLSYRSAVVVDHPGRCPWVRPRLDVAFDLLVGVRRACVFQEVPEEVPVSGLHHLLGQPRQRKEEEEEVPGLPELVRVVQSLREPPRMRRVEDDESVDHLTVVHSGCPGDGSAPVVTDQQRGLGTEFSPIRPRMSAASRSTA